MAPVTPPIDRERTGAAASVGRAGDGAGEGGIRWSKLFWTLIPLAVLGLLTAFGVPVCPAKNLFGVPCPGCGLTRATEAMVTGDLGGMLRFHPMAPLLAPALLYAIGRTVVVSATGKRLKDPLGRLPSWVWGAVAAALVGLWVARMAGLFGGLPDPVDVTRGLLYRGGHFVYLAVTGGS
jgi:hypothetical protein